MTGVFGGGVIFVVAALLWAAVLVPSWVRRREFKAAERNAARLQRTLRVLAETAEVPTEVRVEATAREALAHEKLLRTAQRQQEAERQAKLAEARAAQVRAQMKAQQMKRKQAALVRAARLRRPFVRRMRALAALITVLALAGVLIGVGFIITGAGYAVLAISGAAFIAALGGLVLMAPGRVKLIEIPEEQIVEPEVSSTPPVAAVEAEAVVEDRSAAVHAAAQAAAAARIDRARKMARARAERKNVSAQPRVATVSDAAGANAKSANSAPAEAMPATPAGAKPVRGHEQVASSERLRQMGVIENPSDGMLDLDAVLRQRRRAS